MRQIRLHDTRSGELLPLMPADPDRVGVYACGPTVYSRIHIGNARPYVLFSLVKRFLVHEGYGVDLVINVTDVNDKIYDAACAQGRPSAELAAEMTRLYRADTDALGLGRPDHEPLASQTIGPIVEHIAALIDRGHAYAVDGDVYFRVRSDDGYGSLSHRRPDDMDQGEDVEGAQRKEDPLDFALWKAHKEGEDTVWQSPWGPGRPGWHIECSAMAEQLLGVGFDVHGGGSDLVFPHHENEAAQTRAARGAELTKLWMHNGMIQFTGEKMAKSVGNIALLHEVIDAVGPEAVVMYLISGHYRQPLAFSQAALEQAQANVRRIREAGRRLTPGAQSPPELGALRDRFFDALANDFNTAMALALLNEWIAQASAADVEGRGDAHLREMLGVLGLERLLAPPEAAPGEVLALAEQRERARDDRDFQAADRLRDEIASHGWEVRDVPGGFELSPAVILYGRNPVFEALRGRRAEHVGEVWATDRAAREPWLAKLRPRIVAGEALERRCGSSAHQGVCAESGPYPYVAHTELLASSQPLIVALDQIQDPQNLGSIARTAECAGASGVVIPERRAAEVTPAVCKASAGAVEHLRIARVRNVADFLADARAAGCWCYGASAGRAGGPRSREKHGPVSYDSPDYAGSGVVLVLGSEGSGLRPRVAGACDELIALPLYGRIESLGVSAAAAAILYEILQSRQRGLDNSP